MNNILIYTTLLLFVATLAVARLTYLYLIDIKNSLIIPKAFYDCRVEYELVGIQQHYLVNEFHNYDIIVDINESINNRLIKFLPRSKQHTSYVAKLDKSVHSFTIITTRNSNLIYIAYYSLKI
jgi:hypothetical protein